MQGKLFCYGIRGGEFKQKTYQIDSEVIEVLNVELVRALVRTIPNWEPR